MNLQSSCLCLLNAGMMTMGIKTDLSACQVLKVLTILGTGLLQPPHESTTDQ